MTVGMCGTVANDNARLHVQQILTAEGLLLRRDQLLKPELNQPQGCSPDFQSGPCHHQNPATQSLLETLVCSACKRPQEL